ncbi:hypothetical protein A2Y85_02775 [candidate division WOR-3 bacterium RBG_13_43_14]|uniref:FAD/NAD(P)-binding domain-containing protein n=1 Tax=candidate division WOR-3 bacterium RBG_13_43_14 TaxID=1802590 RepID=A0A1F4U4M7_UNCW3|nr:MAG: hypothetical protein A2Y85_02775 [candidate division WOR-3 bacterium RBG_13_43_14]
MRRIPCIAIIGAGPAGIAAAIQLVRYGYKPMLFEKNKPGGLLGNAFKVENYPGFPEGLSGIDFAEKLSAHLKKYKIPVIMQEVKSVVHKKGQYIIEAEKKMKADILVIASGTKPKRLSLSLPARSLKILSEIYAIRNERHRTIAIIGAGDAALDYALNLCRYNKVILINRRDQIKGLSVLSERLKTEIRNGRVKYLRNAVITKIEDATDGIYLYVRRNSLKKYFCHHAVLAIGREPALDFLPRSFLKHFPNGNRSLYFIGDVKNGDLRQTSIAIGDGMKAAMTINEVIESLNYSKLLKGKPNLDPPLLKGNPNSDPPLLKGKPNSNPPLLKGE